MKGELLEALAASGTAVLDADDPATPGLAARTAAHRRHASRPRDPPTPTSAPPAIALDAELRPPFTLSIAVGERRGRARGARRAPGRERVARRRGRARARRGRSTTSPPGSPPSQPAPWRMEVARTADGVVVLDDAYNANPSSMAAALEALARVEVPGRRVAVLGRDAASSATSATPEHAALGDLVGATAVDALVAVGPEAAPLAEHARAAGVAVTEVPDAATALDAIAGFVHGATRCS